jgi:hypothetical protein
VSVLTQVTLCPVEIVTFDGVKPELYDAETLIVPEPPAEQLTPAVAGVVWVVRVAVKVVGEEDDCAVDDDVVDVVLEIEETDVVVVGEKVVELDVESESESELEAWLEDLELDRTVEEVGDATPSPTA